jgi:branched-chain amino acid transport system substrate-binding protein
VEVLVADHQNKPDIGAAIARSWLDTDGVDMVTDAGNSAVALAVQTVVRERNKVFIASSATSALTGTQCAPTCLHWNLDTSMVSRTLGEATVAAGGDSWFFITADYAFGHQLEQDTTAVIRQAGGRVLGSARYPFPDTTDFSAYLLQAAASGARVLGLAASGNDAVNCIKQAHEFGLTGKMHIAALLIVISTVHAMGAETAEGLELVETFYWNLNDRTRAFTKRLSAKVGEVKAGTMHAGGYGGTLHYLQTVAAMGVADSRRDGVGTVNHMKARRFDNDALGTGAIREDGRVLMDAHLFRVKEPAPGADPWDLYEPLATIPGERAFRPLGDGHCPYVKT